MHRAVSPLAVGLLLGVSMSTAWGLGLGRGSNTSTLGQPLSFSVQVNADVDEILAPECVAAEVFAGDVKLQPPAVTVSLQAGAGLRQATVRVVTTQVIEEPVVTVSVGLGCPQSVSRKFVLFVDPPVIAFAPMVAPDAVTAADTRSANPPAVASSPRTSPRASSSVSAAARSSSNRRERAGRAGLSSAGVTVQERNTASVPALRTSRQPAATRAATRAAASAPGARLKLEPSPVVTALTAAAAVAPAASAVAVAPAVAPAVASAASAALSPRSALAAAAAGETAPAPTQADLLASQRVAALEDSLARLRAEAVATRGSLETLQVRLREADAARASNALVWGLGLLSAALTLAVLALFWRQSRLRRQPAWWADGPADTSRVARPTEVESAGQGETGPMPMPSVVADSGFSASPFTQPMHDAFTVAPAAERPDPLVAPAPAASSTTARELSVDELIDLEQQADFFIVLGQDDAAIDLLMSHVRSTGGVSPMPYIKLLEIYRRQGDLNAYERIRERFNRRFNAEVPGSDIDPEQGRSVEDYPEIVSKLSRLWTSPVQAVEQLGQWLARSGANGPAFDLPAYAELLFLHALARDLAGHDTRGGIDVLLPLATDDEPSIATLSATMPFDPGVPAGATTYEIDLDLTLPVAQGSRRSDELSSDFISLDDDSRYRR